MNPSVYHATPVNVPTGAGELWAQVGRTAMEAATQIQNSALNPAVREQMKYAVANYQNGENYYKYLNSLSPADRAKYWLLQRQTTQGPEMVSPAEAGTPFAPFFQPKINPPPGKEPPPPPKHAPGTGTEPQEQTPKPPAESAPPPPAGNDLENPPSVAQNAPYGYDENGNPVFYAQQGGEVPQPPGGVPPGYFLNPASGSVEPLQRSQPPPAPTAASPQTAPIQSNLPAQIPAAGIVGAAASSLGGPGGAIAGATTSLHPVLSAKTALELAQNFDTSAKRAIYHTQGPTGEPAISIYGAKGQPLGAPIPVSTLVKSGGGAGAVAGENLDTVMKIGASQGQPPAQYPTIASDQGGLQGQPGQSPMTPSPGMFAGSPAAIATTQSPTTPSPGMFAGPRPPMTPSPGMFGPPAAPTQPQTTGSITPSPGMFAGPQPPTPMPSGTGAGAPQGVPAAPGQPPPTPGAYNAAAYQMPQGPTITQTGNVNPALMAGGSDEQALAASRAAAAAPGSSTKPEVTPLTDQEKAVATPEAIAAARTNAKPDTSQPTNEGGDPYMGDMGPWHLYRDDRNKTGELYAARPGTKPFYQQRYYLGSDGWVEYELPNTNMRLQVEAEFGGGKGSVNGAVIPGGGTFRGKNTFPTMSHDEIANLSVPAMQKWLDLAGKYYNTNGEPNSTMEQRLAGLMEMSRRTNRLIDGADIIKKRGIPSQGYGGEAQVRSSEAAERNKLEPPGGWSKGGFSNEGSWWDPGQILINPAEMAAKALAGYHDLRAHGEGVNRFADYLKEQVEKMSDAESQLPGKQMALQKPGEGTSVSVSGFGLNGTAKLGEGAGSARSLHREVNSLFENVPIDQARADLVSHKAEVDRQFEEAYADAVEHNYRLTPAAIAYHHALEVGAGTIDDNKLDNRFRDQNGHLIEPWSKTLSTAIPHISTWDRAALDKLDVQKGDWYTGPDGKPYQRQQ